MTRFFTRVFAGLLLVSAVAAQASDFELGAYVRLPFGSGEPVFGLSAKPVLYKALGENFAVTGDHDAGLHVWIRTKDAPVVALNGVAMGTPRWLSHDPDEKSAGDQGVDWYAVAAVAVGIGLVAAIANADDVTISGCSGPNCPPVKPEPEPEPESAQDG